MLGLGSIVPHRIKGFSGGAKITFPGVAGREMQERNQWEASQFMSETVMGVAENTMRLAGSLHCLANFIGRLRT